MNFMRKAAFFCAGLVVGAALMFVAKNTRSAENAPNVEHFSQFLHRIEIDTLEEVTYTGGEEIAYLTTDGHAFVTTAPPAAFAYVGLTQKLLERGVVVKATQSR